MITSQHGPHQAQQEQLVPVPGEDLHDWARRIRKTAVLHPSVLGQEQARRNQARRRARQRFRVAMRWLAASVAALVVFALLSLAAGGLAWLVAVSAVAVAVTAAVTVRASRQTRPAALDAAMPPRALRQDQVVRLDELNDQCRVLFRHGREALDDHRSSPDDHGNPSAAPAAGTLDRERVEWTLADMLRTITQQRAKYEADPATDPGPAAWRALEVEQEKAEAIVRELEKTVPPSAATDLTIRRYLGMARARRSEDQGISAAAAISAEADSVIEHIRAHRTGLIETQQEFEAKMGETPHPADEG